MQELNNTRIASVGVFAQNNLTLSEHRNTVIAQGLSLGRHFQELALEGSILIYNLNKNRTYEHNPQQLYRNDLPFSQQTMDLVKDIMVYEQSSEYTLRVKTRWLNTTKPELG